MIRLVVCAPTSDSYWWHGNNFLSSFHGSLFLINRCANLSYINRIFTRSPADRDWKQFWSPQVNNHQPQLATVMTSSFTKECKKMFKLRTIRKCSFTFMLAFLFYKKKDTKQIIFSFFSRSIWFVCPLSKFKTECFFSSVVLFWDRWWSWIAQTCRKLKR